MNPLLFVVESFIILGRIWILSIFMML
jgi:hypothetical protein